MSIISRIGITLHATKGRSAISPLHVFLSIAIDFVSRPPESSPVQNKTFQTFFMLIQATPKHITLEVISIKKHVPCQNERKSVRQAQENTGENRVTTIESIEK